MKANKGPDTGPLLSLILGPLGGAQLEGKGKALGLWVKRLVVISYSEPGILYARWQYGYHID